MSSQQVPLWLAVERFGVLLLVVLLAPIVAKSLMGLRGLRAEHKFNRNHERIKSEWGMPRRWRRILGRIGRYFEKSGKNQFPHL